MDSAFRRLGAAAILLTLLTAAPLAATCGGGGGGGLGGISVGNEPMQTPAYRVPWTVLSAGRQPDPKSRLLLYWFPASPQEARASDLQTSRTLSLLAARCVAMAIVPSDNAELRKRFDVGEKAPAVVLADAEGKELGRLPGESQSPPARKAEKLVNSELDRREDALDQQLKAAESKQKQDADGAAALYTAVWGERCLFPKSGKKAAKGLKQLGRPVPEEQVSLLGTADPILSEETAARVVSLMDDGLAAERAGDYRRARDLYARASRRDPADPVPLRYLGELYRHHTGEWAEARQVFTRLLGMPADPLSRAVALHGLGKMTIHEGKFDQGLALLEQSVATYPLPLAYRNLAVYWNSAGQLEKARGYVAKALELAPEEPYNLVFAAVFAAEAGQREAALRTASGHEDLLAASYNLAAIRCLAGDKKGALALLRRHFYDYERYDAVRAMEMKEAREDIVFAAIRQDPEFVQLTTPPPGSEDASPPMHKMP